MWIVRHESGKLWINTARDARRAMRDAEGTAHLTGEGAAMTHLVMRVDVEWVRESGRARRSALSRIAHRVSRVARFIR
jgi:hypothetical protein